MVFPRRFAVPRSEIALEHHVMHVQSSAHYLFPDTFSVYFFGDAELAEPRREREIPGGGQ